jgi:hypothetical protein
MKSHRVPILVAIGMVATSTVLASSTWEPIVKAQLKKEKSCQMIELSGVRTYELAGRHVLEARARCLDGREYDVIRRDTHMRFEFTLCEKQYC